MAHFKKFLESERFERRGKEEENGIRVKGKILRLASFFAGAATASFIGLSVLYKDYKVAHETISQQAKLFHDSLDRRICVLESLRQSEAPPQLAETTD